MTSRSPSTATHRSTLRTSFLVLLTACCAVFPGFAATPDGWPEFRGPFGDGHVAKDPAVGLPLHWSETENVKWKTEIPFLGWSTPVVLGNDVWLTTATEDGHDFFAICVDAETGKVRYNEKLFHADNPEPLGNGVNCYASPSPVIEPGRVYVHFGSYGTACIDTATSKTIWTRTDLPCRHYRGPGASPILFENLLILSFDGADLQYMVGLNKDTGETVWKTDRSTPWKDFDEQGKIIREGDMRKAYCTPLIVDVAGKKQMFTAGSSCAFCYDPLTGKEIWKLPIQGYTPATRPVYTNGLAFFTAGRGKNALIAVKTDGTGDLSDSSIAWKMEGPDVPQEPSPIVVDDLLYILSNSGMLTCLEPATGTPVYHERIGGNFVTSPIYADGRLYFGSTQGKTTIVKVGKTFESLAVNELADGFMASPAVQGKALYLRTKTHLYRIEEPQAPAK